MQAVHRGLPCPEKIGQLACGLKVVLLSILGHIQPIDTSHILAPADDLANETLNGIQPVLSLIDKQPQRPWHIPEGAVSHNSGKN